MDGFKEFYNDRKGKYILFFGFYLIFFIFLAIYIRTARINKPVEEPKEEVASKITTYDLSNLINNDYKYMIKITDYDETGDESVTFEGTKNNVDYANYKNKYFLDIYNVNQLLKRSRYIDTIDGLVLKYELKNSEINDILLTQKEEGINKIEVYVNEEAKVQEIILNLSNYFEKEKYVIEIFYTEVDNNENSPS